MKATVWYDSLVDNHPGALGWFSTEAELWWLPRLGPSAFLMGRRLRFLAETKAVFEIANLGEMVGLTSTSKARYAMVRLVKFGVAAERSDGFGVRNMLPPVTQGHIRNAPLTVKRLWLQVHPETAEVWGVRSMIQEAKEAS